MLLLLSWPPLIEFEKKEEQITLHSNNQIKVGSRNHMQTNTFCTLIVKFFVGFSCAESDLSSWGPELGSAAVHVRPAGPHRAWSSRASTLHSRRHPQPTYCTVCLCACVVRPLTITYFEWVKLMRMGVTSSHIPFSLTGEHAAKIGISCVLHWVF